MPNVWMRAVVCATFALVGCSFDDPSIDELVFRCDGTHPCPAGTSCTGASGVCLRSGPGYDGVVCGTETCPITKKCCVDSANPLRCVGVTEDCPGDTAYCDGVEDCAAGTACCQSSRDQLCARDCFITTCTTNPDCPSREPNCCPVTDEPWGRCQFSPC